MSRVHSQHLILAAALALMIAPGAAHARFGKSDEHKNDQQEQPRSDDQHHHDGNGGNYHSATPVGTSDVPYVRRSCEWDGQCWRHGYGWPAYWYEPAYGSVAPGQVQTQMDQGVRIRSELTGDLMAFRAMDGGAGGLQLRIEGFKWGVAMEGRHIAIAANDGTSATDHLSFFNAFATYALLGGEQGRLRLEAGAQSAFAPDLIVVSPAVGASFALGFGNGFGLEGVARGSLLPHVQLELSGGLSYAFGPLGVRAGWRQIYLNDNGLVDGVAHDDRFSGPYVGVGMAF